MKKNLTILSLFIFSALTTFGQNTIYWTDGGTNTIESYQIETGIRTIVVENLSNPRGIALDTINNKIYWTDMVSSKIQRANLDGTGIEDIITNGLGEPHDIKLDLENQKM